ncbi:hypothetical protein OQH61_00080 [Helicobacter sp. MIT 21-1697]|uniref:hypothetical protein n=1 Tax=Helicobacter sp. MIT 21-1697 TaxID=2993733 RepID=UPI00224AAB86|nr:hypothetical protein [Helicobacter sp. MIT 21-1697]MCX2716137.1 hypothetical protein [Helicobacter sp. MIT 21-1697]
MNLKDMSEEGLLEFIKAIFSLASSFRIWEARKMFSLVCLWLKIKPHLQALDTQDEQQEHILAIINLIGSYRDTHRAEFEEVLDSIFFVAQNKKADISQIIKSFV